MKINENVILMIRKLLKLSARTFGICAGGKENTVMLCAIARIDTQSREKLSALQQAAERFGITVHKIYGHITLATYMGEDDRAFIASCKEILSACTPFSVYYEKVEVLSATSIIVASPRKENALLDMHHAIAAQWGHSLDHWTNNDHWQPHTTLVYDPQIDLQVLAEAMQKGIHSFFRLCDEDRVFTGHSAWVQNR
jgi:hypothetical protein